MTDSGRRYVRTCRRAEYAKSGGWFPASLRQLGGEMNDRAGLDRAIEWLETQLRASCKTVFVGE